MAQAIVKDRDTMHGVPVFRGTRVPVQTLFDYLESGDTLEEFLQGFPTVPRALALDAAEADGFDGSSPSTRIFPTSRTLRGGGSLC